MYECPRSLCVQIEGLIGPAKWYGSGGMLKPTLAINVNGNIFGATNF